MVESFCLSCILSKESGFLHLGIKTDLAKLSKYHGENHNGDHTLNPGLTRRVHLAAYVGNARLHPR